MLTCLTIVYFLKVVSSQYCCKCTEGTITIPILGSGQSVSEHQYRSDSRSAGVAVNQPYRSDSRGAGVAVNQQSYLHLPAMSYSDAEWTVQVTCTYINILLMRLYCNLKLGICIQVAVESGSFMLTNLYIFLKNTNNGCKIHAY